MCVEERVGGRKPLVMCMTRLVLVEVAGLVVVVVVVVQKFSESE